MIDLDNTLVDRSAAVSSWVAEFCSSKGLTGDSMAWILALDNDGYSARREVFTAIAQRFELTETVDALLAAYRRRIIELTSPSPGAVECLASLKAAGHRVAIVSNGSSGQQHGKINALGLGDLVDAVCISGDLGVKKPDQRIYREAARQTDAQLEGAWMVGDSPLHDIAGADRLGLSTAWLSRGRTWQETSYAPTMTLESLEQLSI